MRSVVDLPQPDGPSSTMNSPSATVNETSSTDGAGGARVALADIGETNDGQGCSGETA